MRTSNQWNHLDLFSGIGGFSLGLETLGTYKTIAFCEIDQFCQSVLRKHWADVPIFGDVRRISARDLKQTVDIITGGFPCQDISVGQQHRVTKGGKAYGIKGKRSGLWKEYKRLIKEIQPRWAVIENVEALYRRGLAEVLRDLHEIGYDAEWHTIAAADLGAPHERRRIFIIAYPTVGNSNGPRLQRLGRFIQAARQRSAWSSGEGVHGHDGTSRLVKPGVHVVVDGIPGRVQRIKSTGNAIVPQIAEAIGLAIIEAEKSRH